MPVGPARRSGSRSSATKRAALRRRRACSISLTLELISAPGVGGRQDLDAHLAQARNDRVDVHVRPHLLLAILSDAREPVPVRPHEAAHAVAGLRIPQWREMTGHVRRMLEKAPADSARAEENA